MLKNTLVSLVQHNKPMGPTPEFSTNPQSVDDNHSGRAATKYFQHSRNMTGVMGDSQWHQDIKVNELWEKLSVPEPNDVEYLQKSVVSHVINTLARTHFNCDDLAGYQAAAHR